MNTTDMNDTTRTNTAMKNIDILNNLHTAMIKLYSGDAKRIQHFCKVHSYARLIAKMEHVDNKTLFVIETAALTHDIGIHICEEKYGECGGKLQEKEGPSLAGELLHKLGFEPEISERVQYLIAHHHTYDQVDGPDYRILLEADFLVNAFEDNLPKDAIIHFRDKVFETKTGLHLLNTMFGL